MRLAFVLICHFVTAYAQVNIEGEYRNMYYIEREIDNDWHCVTIYQDFTDAAVETYIWRNSAGVEWKMYPDYVSGVLQGFTYDSNNPYGLTNSTVVYMENGVYIDYIQKDDNGLEKYNKINQTKIEGEYRNLYYIERGYGIDWHYVTITQDTTDPTFIMYIWRNSAGFEWTMYPDYEGIVLKGFIIGPNPLELTYSTVFYLENGVDIDYIQNDDMGIEKNVENFDRVQEDEQIEEEVQEERPLANVIQFDNKYEKLFNYLTNETESANDAFHDSPTESVEKYEELIQTLNHFHADQLSKVMAPQLEKINYLRGKVSLLDKRLLCFLHGECGQSVEEGEGEQIVNGNQGEKKAEDNEAEEQEPAEETTAVDVEAVCEEVDVAKCEDTDADAEPPALEISPDVEPVAQEIGPDGE